MKNIFKATLKELEKKFTNLSIALILVFTIFWGIYTSYY